MIVDSGRSSACRWATGSPAPPTTAAGGWSRVRRCRPARLGHLTGRPHRRLRLRRQRQPHVGHQPKGRTTTFAYDDADLPVTVTDPLGQQTLRGYDGLGRLTTLTDRNGDTMVREYDPSAGSPSPATAGRPGRVTRAAGPSPTTAGTGSPRSRTPPAAR
ncbi:RHS repeat protein [Micromonospora sp. HNM0581]|nr:RHS repeat protein [Micromonospora sp. HNM0581]